MESGLVRALDLDEGLMAFVVDDINWKNKYIGSETIRRPFPNEGKQVGNF